MSNKYRAIMRSKGRTMQKKTRISVRKITIFERAAINTKKLREKKGESNCEPRRLQKDTNAVLFFSLHRLTSRKYSRHLTIYISLKYQWSAILQRCQHVFSLFLAIQKKKEKKLANLSAYVRIDVQSAVTPG